MKKYLLFIVFLLTCCSSIFAQVNPPLPSCGISFTYDDAGNRVKRFVCVNDTHLRFTEPTQDDQLTQTIDLKATLEDSGYSEEMESEIEKLEALLAQPAALEMATSTENKQLLELTNQNFGSLSGMIVFPNPTMETFSIQGQGLQAEATVSIVDMSGRILSQRLLGDGSKIDVSALPSGTYMVTLLHKDDRKVALLVK
ncbi:MAG: T9SS type A sorting domain-containing protein, partial [Bacteroidota bacterium]